MTRINDVFHFLNSFPFEYNMIPLFKKYFGKSNIFVLEHHTTFIIDYISSQGKKTIPFPKPHHMLQVGQPLLL
jgi:hypothetical protein